MKKLMLWSLSVITGSLFAQSDEEGNETFVQWDLDRDGYIMDDEYSEFWDKSNFQERWDKDGDGLLNKDEWQKGVDTYYRANEQWPENLYREYDEWDVNGDGTLDGDEFREGNYNTWDFDRDGRIAEEEYYNYYHLD